MKSYIYHGFIWYAATIVLTSCSDYLDVKPDSVFTENNVENPDGNGPKYTTKQDMDLLRGGIYSGFKGALSNTYNLDLLMLSEARSDNAYSGSIEGWALELDNFNVTPNNAVTARGWGQYFQMIGQANLIIDNVDAITDPALTPELKTAYKAEAMILRGMMYFDLVRLYGDVPLVLQETPDITAGNIEEVYPLLYPSRESAERIYEQIIADLQFGAEQGPEPVAEDKFKLSRALADGLLAKVYATRQNKDWEKVKRHCERALGYGYRLVDDYEQLWEPGSRNTSESIFEISHTADSPNWGWSMFVGADWRKFCTPSHDLEAAFDSQKDVIRKNAAIWVEPCSWDNFWPAAAYRFAYKIRNNLSSIILLRAGDVLLLKAEACIETGALQEAADLIDTVRARARLAPLSEADKKDRAAMRRAVALERRLELAMEGHRWFDLVRTGQAVETMRNCKDSKGAYSYKLIEEWMLLYPVPQTERDQNPNLTQNPGY